MTHNYIIYRALLQYKSRFDKELSFMCGGKFYSSILGIKLLLTIQRLLLGALISKFYVLTAAHCINVGSHAL